MNGCACVRQKFAINGTFGFDELFGHVCFVLSNYSLTSTYEFFDNAHKTIMFCKYVATFLDCGWQTVKMSSERNSNHDLLLPSWKI